MIMLGSMSTGDGFKKYFEILPAIGEADRRAAFRIRHSVYCEDLGWEPVRADGLETDEYDGQARHCLVRNRATGEHIGCVQIWDPDLQPTPPESARTPRTPAMTASGNAAGPMRALPSAP